MEAFADVVHSGKAHYIGVSEWTRRGDPARRTRWPASCASRWSPTSRSTPCSGGSSRPRSCRRARSSASARSSGRPIAQGVLTGKYLPGEAAAGRLPRHRREGRRRLDQALARPTTCSPGCSSCVPLADEAGLTMAQLAVAWVLQNPNVSSAIVGASRPEQVADNVRRLRREARRRPARGDRRDPRRPSSSATRPRPSRRPSATSADLEGASSRRVAGSSGRRPRRSPSRRTTCSTPWSSRSRQVSPTQVSASLCEGKRGWSGSPPSGDATCSPEASSRRHHQTAWARGSVRAERRFHADRHGLRLVGGPRRTDVSAPTAGRTAAW